MIRLFLLLFLPLLAVPVCTAKPIIFAINIDSGPNTGGQNNNGLFVTIYGKNFGTHRGNSYVTIGGGQADNYPVWGATVDRGPSNLDFQKITFQLGANAQTGPVRIYHETAGWNETYYDMYGNGATGPTFTVRSGNIYFIDINAASNGDGSYASPWNAFGDHNANYTAAYQTMGPGDTLFFRGGNYEGPWGDHQSSTGSVIRFDPRDYNWDGATPSTRIVLCGYPAESATIYAPDSTSPVAGITAYTNIGLPNYLTVTELNFSTWSQAISSNSGDVGCLHDYSKGLRVIGCDISGMYNDQNEVQAGALGLGRSGKIIACQIHNGRNNISNKPHAIYESRCNWDDDVEIAYNYIYDNDYKDGNWIAINHEGEKRCVDSAAEYSKDTYIHHNVIDADTGSSMQASMIGVYDKAYDPDDPDDQIPTTFIYSNLLIGAPVMAEDQMMVYWYNGHIFMANNTLYFPDYTGDWDDGIIEWQDMNTAGTGVNRYVYDVNVKNNIVVMGSSPAQYIRAHAAYPQVTASFSVDSNLGYGNGVYSGTGGKSIVDANAASSDPNFTSAESKNFSLNSDSPARSQGADLSATAVKTDINGTPWESEYDIGAFVFSSTNPQPSISAPQNLHIVTR